MELKGRCPLITRLRGVFACKGNSNLINKIFANLLFWTTKILKNTAFQSNISRRLKLGNFLLDNVN